MNFKLLNLDNKLKNDPSLALDVFPEGIAVHASPKMAAILRANVLKLTQKKVKGRAAVVNQDKYVSIVQNSAVHNDSYILVQLFEKDHSI